MAIERVISGMRPTGNLHLGHYNGVLKNWINLQHEFECLFFVADWHALTTHYDSPEIIEENVWEMVVDWLAAGVDPATATIFIQSKVPEHAELHTLLSMITPLGWLERVPTYKDQQEKLSSKDLSTYGFLGYPLLQSADILIYKATQVPVGEDQIPHIEFTREIARRFNHLYGKETGFVEKAEEAIKKLGSKKSSLYMEMKTAYQENGDQEALDSAQVLIEEHQGLSLGDKERLLGFLEGGGKMILVEPEYKLAPASKMIGLDGQKMSKSFGNYFLPKEIIEGTTELFDKPYSANVLRFFMMQAHYRSNLDFTQEALNASEKGFSRLMEGLKTIEKLPTSTSSFDVDALIASFHTAMNDDFNAPILVANLFEAVKYINLINDGNASISENDKVKLIAAMNSFIFDVLGLVSEQESESGKLSPVMDLVLDLRQQARTNKDWTTSDKIRDGLAAAGIVVKDGKEGTSWS